MVKILVGWKTHRSRKWRSIIIIKTCLWWSRWWLFRWSKWSVKRVSRMRKKQSKKKQKKNIPLGLRSIASWVLFVLVQVWVIMTCGGSNCKSKFSKKKRKMRKRKKKKNIPYPRHLEPLPIVHCYSDWNGGHGSRACGHWGGQGEYRS